MPTEVVQIAGHILDSLTLTKVFDALALRGVSYDVEDIEVGKKKKDPSRARIKISAPSRDLLEEVLGQIHRYGAVPLRPKEVRVEAAPADRVFPRGFYSTTNLPTSVFFGGRWCEVEGIEMDCGIRMEGKERDRASCVAMNHVRRGDTIIVGREGVRVEPELVVASKEEDSFRFMASGVSIEKPKGVFIRDLARTFGECRRHHLKVLFVVGPALIHTGGGPHLEELVRRGMVDLLFAGNGFAVHDIESSLYGTSLGVEIRTGRAVPGGHDHHMRAINEIRLAGGIRRAVETGILKGGVMHALTVKKVEYVLAGSVRDDGPLPEVITDTQEAQEGMRQRVKGVGLAVMIASGLHAIATGNLLPATVKTVIVDINPSIATKLCDRGTFQSLSLVTDATSFLKELLADLIPPSREIARA